MAGRRNSSRNSGRAADEKEDLGAFEHEYEITKRFFLRRSQTGQWATVFRRFIELLGAFLDEAST